MVGVNPREDVEIGVCRPVKLDPCIGHGGQGDDGLAKGGVGRQFQGQGLGTKTVTSFSVVQPVKLMSSTV